MLVLIFFFCLMQPAAKPETGKVDPSGGETAEEQAAKEEADARSVYVGNVDYECTPEELQVHFQVMFARASLCFDKIDCDWC